MKLSTKIQGLAMVFMAAGLYSGQVGATMIDLGPSPSGVRVQLDTAGGRYSVSEAGPAWTFGGAVGGPVSDFSTAKGKDQVGRYREVSFRVANSTPLRESIRRYDDRPLVLFTVTCLAATDRIENPFPAFTTIPAGLHPFSYRSVNFSPRTFSLAAGSTPFLLFDDQANAAVLSPASNFMVARLSGDGVTSLASGFRPELAGLPRGFTHRTLLTLGHGINHTWDVWGRAMTDLQGKKRPANDADVFLKYFGYWTDNGADYYYDYDRSLGYANTLVALAKRYRQERIPIRYMQLDSWWYQKSTADPRGVDDHQPKKADLPAGTWNAYGGLMLYQAHPDLFPNGLAAFQKQVGLPMTTHNRWIDRNSPYHAKYKISGLGAVDPRWWDGVMSYLKSSGVQMYEQDWLVDIYNNSPQFKSTTWAGAAFCDQMARAAAQRSMTLQYCMALPQFFLQGSKYANLTSIRVSDDRFKRERWDNFLYTSCFASSLGIWPWADVFMSGETENVLLATLSAGVVGTGDRMGKEDVANIRLAARADGVLVKPDRAIVPTDASYVNDANKRTAPLTSWTETDHGTHKTLYVFAYARKPGENDVRFRPADLGLKGTAYVYDFFGKSGVVVPSGAVFTSSIPDNGSAYYVVAPVKNGIAMVGDTGKFASMGRQRVMRVDDGSGVTTLVIAFAPTESSVVLHGYAVTRPEVPYVAGVASPVTFDGATHQFSLKLSPRLGDRPRGRNSDPVRLAFVMLAASPRGSRAGH